MFKDLLEGVTGKWGLLALVVLAMPSGRRFIRSAAKEAIRAGVTVGERVKEMAEEIKEEANDVVAEVRAERAGNAIDHKPGKSKAAHSAQS